MQTETKKVDHSFKCKTGKVHFKADKNHTQLKPICGTVEKNRLRTV